MKSDISENMFFSFKLSTIHQAWTLRKFGEYYQQNIISSEKYR